MAGVYMFRGSNVLQPPESTKNLTGCWLMVSCTVVSGFWACLANLHDFKLSSGGWGTVLIGL